MNARPRRFPLLALPLALLVACSGSDEAGEGTASLFQDDHAHPAGSTDGIGTVHFPVTCSDEARHRFEQGVAMLHSFWFEAADAAFLEVAELDPGCAMAHWGRAMTLWGNPMTRAAPPEARLNMAVQAVQEARALSERATPRERAYIEAAAALYDGHPDTGHLPRMRAHEEAMREVMEAHPEDPEAAIFYGRIVVGNAPPDDLTFARQLHAAAILEPLFAEQPDHPGLAHYLIHAFDAPALAEEGLAAALRYAEIAPDAPHALHMPTHIFTRMGLWEESIELNARSAQAEPNPDAAVHPLDYMVYAYLQLGRDTEAAEVVARARDIPDEYYGGLIGYNFAAMPVRLAVERSRWEDTGMIPVPVDAPAYVEAVARFGRALGSARAGRIEAAESEHARLVELVEVLHATGEDYWATVVEAQRLAAEAWIRRSEGDSDTALRLAREAADLEGTVEKHPVTPGPLLPALELLGDLLMELERPEEALRAYEETLETEPNRARTLYGAATSAEAAGDAEAARRYYMELRELLQTADPDRPELAAIRAFEERS
jgi:tetratricopeptide (TPR) repeat protein